MKSVLRKGMRIAMIPLLGMLSHAAFADSLALRGGQHVHGTFAGGTQGVLAFVVDGATQYFDVKDVMVVTFGQDSEVPEGYYQQPPQVGPPSNGSLIRQKNKIPPKTGSPNLKANRVPVS